MGEFFKGWRRKMGCVTLAMACVVIAIWMSCLFNRPYINLQMVRMIRVRNGSVRLITDGDSLRLVRFEKVRPKPEPTPVITHSPDVNQDGGSGKPESQDGDPSVNTVASVMRLGTARMTRYKEISIVAIPFWQIVLPLTLLSAYLLLSKPRTANTRIPDRESTVTL